MVKEDATFDEMLEYLGLRNPMNVHLLTKPEIERMKELHGKIFEVSPHEKKDGKCQTTK